MKKVLFTILLSLIYLVILVSFALPHLFNFYGNSQAGFILIALLCFTAFMMGSTNKHETHYLDLIGIPAIFTLGLIFIFKEPGAFIFGVPYAIFEFVFFRIGLTYQLNKKEAIIHFLLVFLFFLCMWISLFGLRTGDIMR